MPNLYVGGSVTWADLISGSTFQGGGIIAPTCFGPTCGRRDFTETDFTIDAEFLISETFPLSIFGGYTFTDFKQGENISNPIPHRRNGLERQHVLHRVRYYMGGMGTLIELHRTGNLRPWLRGAN